MVDIEKLKLRKLIKELEYIKLDFAYKSEIISKNNNVFLEDVHKILDTNEELKLLFEESKQLSYVDDLNVDIDSNQIDKTEVDPKVKTLYRSIVKKSHPDVSDSNLYNDIYIEATEAYKNNDIFSIVSICDKFGLDYEIESDLIENELSSYKNRIFLLESTFTYKIGRAHV